MDLLNAGHTHRIRISNINNFGCIREPNLREATVFFRLVYCSLINSAYTYNKKNVGCSGRFVLCFASTIIAVRNLTSVPVLYAAGLKSYF